MKHREIRALLRKALKLDPAAFDEVVHDYLANGRDALAPERPGSGAGRPKKITRGMLLLLLANVKNAEEDGKSENQKCKELAQSAKDHGAAREFVQTPGVIAEEGWWGNEYGDRRGFPSANTLRQYVSRAKKLYRDDAEFREEVHFYQWAFRQVGL